MVKSEIHFFVCFFIIIFSSFFILQTRFQKGNFHYFAYFDFEKRLTRLIENIVNLISAEFTGAGFNNVTDISHLTQQFRSDCYDGF